MTGLEAEAAALDAADPLAHKRKEFDLDPEVAYFDGNSLGAPHQAKSWWRTRRA